MSGLYRLTDEISPTTEKKLGLEGDDHSRAGRKRFKNKGLRTIAASETFSSPRAEKPVKFHRGIIESNFCSRIGDIGAQGKVSALVRLATRGRQRSTGSKKLKIPVRNVIYISSPKFKPP